MEHVGFDRLIGHYHVLNFNRLPTYNDPHICWTATKQFNLLNIFWELSSVKYEV